ncbi:MAG TPA: DoxX family protein [Polyangiaceae bacterium]|nr:DoxX family protein [Polyangiaceae bacterium]
MVKRIAAGVGVIVAGCFAVATIALITFAQVLPAIVTLVLAVTIGLFSITTLNPPESEKAPELDAPVREPVSAAERASWAPSRIATVVRSLSFVLAAAFVYAGVLQATGAQFVIQRYHSWHYPLQLMWIVGWVELVAAIALAVPWMAKYGALVLMPIMLGAAYTLLFRGDPYWVVLPLALFGLLAFVFWEHTEAHFRGLRRARADART